MTIERVTEQQLDNIESLHFREWAVPHLISEIRALWAERDQALDCYLREGEPRADHDLSEGVVCARCYGALAELANCDHA